MATIGSVTKRDDGRYEGELRTLSIRAEIAIVPVPTRRRRTSRTIAWCRRVSRSVLAGSARARCPARTTSRCRLRRRSSVPRRSTPISGRAAGPIRSGRLRAHLESARLSAALASPSRRQRRGGTLCFPSPAASHPPARRRFGPHGSYSSFQLSRLLIAVLTALCPQIASLTPIRGPTSVLFARGISLPHWLVCYTSSSCWRLKFPHAFRHRGERNMRDVSELVFGHQDKRLTSCRRQ